MTKFEKFDLTHARHDPAHCLAPGLFRSLKRGERKSGKLNVVYEYGQGQKIEFSGPEPLGVDDLRVLQGLVATAGPSGLVLSPEPQTEAGLQLRIFMEPRWDAIRKDAMVVKGSYRALAREIGYANIEDTKRIRDCIERLWKVSIIASLSGGKRQGFRLLADYTSDDSRGSLFVALNPMIATAIMGGQHVRLNLDEIRSLKSDAARLIHQRLCGWVDPGKTRSVELDTLCSYIWPEPASNSSMRKRRQRARECLPELTYINWNVNEYAKGKFAITRPHHGNCHKDHVNRHESPRQPSRIDDANPFDGTGFTAAGKAHP